MIRTGFLGEGSVENVCRTDRALPSFQTGKQHGLESVRKREPLEACELCWPRAWGWESGNPALVHTAAAGSTAVVFFPSFCGVWGLRQTHHKGSLCSRSL